MQACRLCNHEFPLGIISFPRGGVYRRVCCFCTPPKKKGAKKKFYPLPINKRGNRRECRQCHQIYPLEEQYFLPIGRGLRSRCVTCFPGPKQPRRVKRPELASDAIESSPELVSTSTPESLSESVSISTSELLCEEQTDPDLPWFYVALTMVHDHNEQQQFFNPTRGDDDPMFSATPGTPHPVCDNDDPMFNAIDARYSPAPHQHEEPLLSW